MIDPSPPAAPAARFVRLAETQRTVLRLTLDGAAVQALEGDTLLVALLNQADSLRHSEFGDGPRAGFCLMGACQDCWVWTAQGERLRACTTVARDGMAIVRQMPDATWPCAS
ncbi:MAG TPA: (2Fe-2S)-binding protein [Ideonella sp.]|nr:(2Fe-2S)-binding protein [Ideonella sp.]